MSPAPSHDDLLRLAARITSAHAAHNTVSPDLLPGVIESVYAALSRVSTDSLEAPTAERPQPAVPIRKSVFADHLVCLEDGKTFKALKRHLRAVHGLTPEQYRTRWELPPSYPIVAPDYAATRSTLARKAGLGRKPAATAEPGAPSIQRVAEGVSGARTPRKLPAG